MFNLTGLQWAKVFFWIFMAVVTVIMAVVAIIDRKKGRKSRIKPMSIHHLLERERELRENPVNDAVGSNIYNKALQDRLNPDRYKNKPYEIK
jgi:uncharacterized membrane protein